MSSGGFATSGLQSPFKWGNPVWRKEHYLTPEQQAIFNQASQKLQRTISEQLLSTDQPQHLKVARLILDILKFYPSDATEVKDCFFHTLLCNNKAAESLEKVLLICQRGGAKAFFSCITTQQKIYYSIPTLYKIVKLFDELTGKSQQFSTLFSHCPPYDNGGEELLLKLKLHPEELGMFLQHHVGTTREFMLPEHAKKHNFFHTFHSFTRMKQEAIRFLASLPEANRSPINNYLKIFRNLENSPELVSLSETTKAALIKLLIVSSCDEQKHVAQKTSISDFEEMINEALLTHQKWGEEPLVFICNAPCLCNATNPNQIIHLLRLINALSNKTEHFSQIHTELILLSQGNSTIAQLLHFLENLAPNLHDNSPNTAENISEFIVRFKNDINVLFPLSNQDLEKIQTQYTRINGFCEEWKKLRIGQLVDRAHSIQAEAKELGFHEDHILQLFAIGRLALFIKFQTYPHITQVLTVLGQLGFEKGAIAQVKTGEGKSLIVTLLGFVLAMQNKSIHIISSSRNLSVRDQAKVESFFNAFGITTSHICEDQPPATRFQAQLLYGTATDFEFAIMREMLYFQPLFLQKKPNDSQHRFDCVIIDELDNLTIDTASNQARLSYPMEETFDWVYFPIFNFVRMNIHKDEQEKTSEPATLRDLRTHLREYSQGVFREIEPKISDDQLKEWLSSAFAALHLKEENKHYTIHEEKKVVIVDAENTGRLMWNSRWGHGLHEFVEVKHNLIPERESLTPLSLSHAVFYQMYGALYGLTGTLGSEFERNEIKNIYGASSFDVPTYRPSVRKNLPLSILPNKEFLLESIKKKVISCRQQGRPILIICKTISDSLMLEKLLKEEQVPLEVLNELQETEEEEILRKAGRPGAVTVATNTAGRGTDIKLEGKSDNNGGLHILITFWPESQRVEDQARGRAGRQGQNGSSEIMACVQDLELDQSVDVTSPQIHAAVVAALAEKRATQARMMQNMHLMQAAVERFCFNITREFFDLYGHFHEAIEKGEILRQWSKKLSTRKIKSRDTDLSQLRPKDRLLAQNALALLQDKDENVLPWQVLLQKVAKRLENYIINDWSLRFYQRTEEMLSNNGTSASVLMRTKLQNIMNNFQLGPDAFQFFQNLESLFSTHQNNNLSQLRQELQSLYDSLKTNWEKALHPSGSGIIQYLRNVTQTALVGL